MCNDSVTILVQCITQNLYTKSGMLWWYKETLYIHYTNNQDPKLTFERGRQGDDLVLGFSRPEKNLVVPSSHPQKED